MTGNIFVIGKLPYLLQHFTSSCAQIRLSSCLLCWRYKFQAAPGVQLFSRQHGNESQRSAEHCLGFCSVTCVMLYRVFHDLWKLLQEEIS